MRILAIETTGRHGSLAALDGDLPKATPLRELRLDGGRTAQVLAPALQSLLSDIGWPARSIELVAVAVGPGSFTGLRIGVTTAKTLAYAIGAQIVAVETMDALAAQAPPAPASLWTLMDAQRHELFVAKFSVSQGGTARQGATQIVSQEEWLAGLSTGDRVTGPPLGRLMPQLPRDIVVLSEEVWQPMATAVGLVAWQAYQRGQRDDVWTLSPEYYRMSAAEEKRGAKPE